MSHESPNEPPTEPDLRAGELFRMAWTFYLVLAIAGVIWLALAEGSLTLGLFVDTGGIGLDLALGVGCAAVLSGGWRGLRRFSASMRELEGVMRRWFGSIDSSEIFVLALISGFSEELFFRGALQSSLGWIWATLIFTLLHSGPGRVFRIWTAFALVAGLLFAALVEYRGNLLAATVAHVLVNWINLHGLTRMKAEPDPSPPA